MLVLALALTARADTISLDTGATIEGDLARYEVGGDCQISIGEGPLTGAILIVPCHRVASFVRTQNRKPVAIGLPSTDEMGGESATQGVAEGVTEVALDSVAEVIAEPAPQPRARLDDGVIPPAALRTPLYPDDPIFPGEWTDTTVESVQPRPAPRMDDRDPYEAPSPHAVAF